jgi:hypothetical protein
MHHLVIEPAKGTFTGVVPARSYELHIRASTKPSSVTVDGREVAAGEWNESQRIATVLVPSRSTRERVEISWRD